MITREQIRDLRPGDVVELSWPTTSGHPDVTMTARGPLHSISGQTAALFVGCYAVRDRHGEPVYGDRRSLTVVSRAPRPLYVNHDRTEPVPGDVVRDADDARDTRVWLCEHEDHWWHTETTATVPLVTWRSRSQLPDRLRLLVDGETGQAVTA